MAKGLSVRAQSANTLLQDMSLQMQSFLSALFRGLPYLFTLTWKHVSGRPQALDSFAAILQFSS